MRLLIGSVLLLVLPPTLAAQSSHDPRERRAKREQAVAQVGTVARALVETHGEEAVAALFACSRPVAVKLAEFHASGGLGNFPKPYRLLALIAAPGHGDDVALFAIQHAEELTDADTCDAFLQAPLEYALGLKSLAEGAAEMRARPLSRRSGRTPGPEPSFAVTSWLPLGLSAAALLVAVFAVALWACRRPSES